MDACGGKARWNGSEHQVCEMYTHGHLGMYVCVMPMSGPAHMYTLSVILCVYAWLTVCACVNVSALSVCVHTMWECLLYTGVHNECDLVAYIYLCVCMSLNMCMYRVYVCVNVCIIACATFKVHSTGRGWQQRGELGHHPYNSHASEERARTGARHLHHLLPAPPKDLPRLLIGCVTSYNKCTYCKLLCIKASAFIWDP